MLKAPRKFGIPVGLLSVNKVLVYLLHSHILNDKQKLTDLDLHCLQRQGICVFSRNRFNYGRIYRCVATTLCVRLPLTPLLTDGSDH